MTTITRLLPLVLVGCAARATPPAAPTPAPPPGRLLAADAWVAIDVGNPNHMRTAPAPLPDCDATPAPAVCAGRWLSDEIRVADEGGMIDAIYETPAGLTMQVTRTVSCGAQQIGPHWRVLLPLPRRPVVIDDVTPPSECHGQP
jgi:hypothetical protein